MRLRLPMAEIAFASGFGSVRRFNEAFQTLFGRPPGELRRSSKSDVVPGPAGEIVLLLRYHPPYDWSATLEFLRQRAIAGVEFVTANRYARSVKLDGVQGTVAVEPADGNALRATVRFPKLSALPAIIARLRRVFDLAADPLAIAAHLTRDPTLSPLVKARPGLRVPGAWDGFELAIRAVLGQQITVAAAARLAGRLVAAHGERLQTADENLTHVFPEPESLASADLSSLGMPRSRAAALSAVAAAAIADHQLFEANCGLDDAVKRLRAIHGVGEWTAQYIALRQLREPDAFPAADLGLMRAIANREGRRHSSSRIAGAGRCVAALARLRRAAPLGVGLALRCCLCAPKTFSMLASTCRVCPLMSPGATVLPAASIATLPATKIIRLPVTSMPCEKFAGLGRSGGCNAFLGISCLRRCRIIGDPRPAMQAPPRPG